MKKIQKILNWLAVGLFPIAIFYLFELFTHNPWTTMKVPIQFLNIILFELVFGFLFFLCKRIDIALYLQTILFLIIGLANYYIIDFRSAPIMPWDIFSIKTAASVANNYKYSISIHTILVLCGFIVLLALIYICHRFFLQSKINLNWKWRICGVLISTLLLITFTSFVQKPTTVTRFKMYDKLFTPTVMSKRDGTAVAFLMELQYLSIDKPDGYSTTAATELIDSYTTNIDPQTVEKKPNIIVIMNEAFSDPSILGEFSTNKEYIPFVHSLLQEQSNHILSGYLNVSVLGGNTANTEFEFLTGNTMAFLPQGSVAYQQYVKHNTPSIASWLKELGYETIAMHPYNRSGWDRDKVYPLLGFDTFYSINDWSNPQKIRKYVSDQSCYDKIIALYEEKEPQSPFFIFNVTMQNHSSYSEEFDNFTPDIEVENTNSKVLPNYLSLLRKSDDAIHNLVSYFETVEEPTIIVFFGDHQTTNSVMAPIYKINQRTIDSLSEEEQNLRYKVPFFIYCNYEIDGNNQIETSANFLKDYVLDIAGLPKDPYSNYLSTLQVQYPIVTSIRAESKDGHSEDFKNVQDQLNEYAILQYYYLFGQK